MGKGNTKARGRGWPLVATIFVFIAAIAALIAPETLLGNEARVGPIARAPALGRVSDIMMAAAALCAFLLLLGWIRRSSSPRFSAQIMRFTLALGIAAIVIVVVQVLAGLPEVKRADLLAALTESGTVQGLGISVALFLFGCALVGFSAFRSRPAPALSRASRAGAPAASGPTGATFGTAPVSGTTERDPVSLRRTTDDAASPRLTPVLRPLSPAVLTGVQRTPSLAPAAPPVPSPAASSAVASDALPELPPLSDAPLVEDSLATAIAIDTAFPPPYTGPSKGADMRDIVGKPDAAAERPRSEPYQADWDEGGLAPPGLEFGLDPLPVPIAEREPSRAPVGEELRAEIRRRLEARPAMTDEAKALLHLIASHDAGFATALAKLPERQGIGGAVLAAMIQQYKGSTDLVLLTRAVTAALVFWPEKGPSHSTIEDIALRLAEFSHDAAREFSRAYNLLGSRFSLQYSLKVVLQKYGISQSTFDAIRPDEGLNDAMIRGMLAQSRIDLVNEILKPFEIVILEKIGSVVPVYSVLEKNHDRYVMNADEFVELLRKRNVIR